MKTKRLVAAGVAAPALAGGAGRALAVGGPTPAAGSDATDAGSRRAAAGREAADVHLPGRAPAASAGPRVVRPTRPVEIGQGAKTGLLPEGRQNYVVAWNDYEAAVEQARSLVGDDVRPDSISAGMGVDGDDVLFTGAFRTDTVPARHPAHRHGRRGGRRHADAARQAGLGHVLLRRRDGPSAGDGRGDGLRPRRLGSRASGLRPFARKPLTTVPPTRW